jgi:alpha-glucosidase
MKTPIHGATDESVWQLSPLNGERAGVRGEFAHSARPRRDVSLGARLAFFLTAAVFCGLASSSALEVASPDGRVVLNFEVKDFAGAKACPVYRVSYQGRTILTDSRLGFELTSGPLMEGFEIVGQTESRVETQWKPVYGERSVIRDRHQQVIVELRQKAPPQRRMHVILRAYNEGAAFCYSLPVQEAWNRIESARERTEFRLAGDFPAWATYTAQGVYTNIPISQIKAGCERPLVMRVADDCYAALAEARLVDYARMKFAPLAGVPHSLVSQLDGGVSAALPLTTPWRVVMVAESPGRLLENNDLMLNLNDPCAIADTSWIKPGKVIREVTLTTQGGRACVDFAVQHRMQYVEFDAGWYGAEGSDASDARAVNLDPKRSKGPLDLREVIRYASERGIGILLYVNQRALTRQLDEILPFFRRWGVKGVKYGFVNVGTQKSTAWLHEAVRKAAAHQLMVDIHDEYRPTGFSRTYPNLMTQEGVRGDEERQPVRQTLATLFTRMLAGPADFTVCYYDARVEQNASHAFQLAKPVCFYSPFQFLFWYDRPKAAPAKVGGAGNAETSIGNEPEIEFYDRLPTVWDDTRVLDGRIGEFAVIARRSGAEWFVGFLNSGQSRTLPAKLDFLEEGRRYVAHIYSDDPAVPTKTQVRIDRHLVERASVLKLSAGPQGGQAMRLVPATAGDAFPIYR